MFYDDLICSLTNTGGMTASPGTKTILNDSSPSDTTNETTTSPSTSTSTTTPDSNNKPTKNTKYFAEIDKLYILGEHYAQPIDESKLAKDISTRIWFSYRKGFSKINGNGPDSDQGWGCMIRCGQMMLAETFLRIYLDRGFRWNADLTGNPFYWKILSYFRDEKLAPYSIQQIATMGEGESIQIGKWFGPNAIAQVLHKLTTFEESNHLQFYIGMDNCIFIDEIYESQKKYNKSNATKSKKHSKSTDAWYPLLIIIPLRLGLNEFNLDYKDALKKCLRLKQTVGMIGGKPNQAYYFYGYADDELLYLDPHEVQPYVPNFVEDMNDSTYHTNTMWKLKFSQLDPSIALGFLCKLEEDFLDLIDSLRNKVVNKDDVHSLFEIAESRPDFESGGSDLLDTDHSDSEFVLI